MGWLGVAAGPALANVVFTDTTFNLGNYLVIGPYKSDPSISASYGQCAACGDPGQALQIQFSFPTQVATQEVAYGFVNTTFTYNPHIQGPITVGSAAVDKNVINTASGTFGNTFYPLIEQDGKFYLGAIAGGSYNAPITTGYLHFGGTGDATSFTQFDFTTGTFGTAHPNFAGDPIMFGLAQITTFNNVTGTFEADYDNLTFVISTPEPVSVALLASGLAGLIAFRRRGGRNQRHRSD